MKYLIMTFDWLRNGNLNSQLRLRNYSRLLPCVVSNYNNELDSFWSIVITKYQVIYTEVESTYKYYLFRFL